MILLDERQFFQKFITFTASVHQLKHALTNDLRPTNLTPIQYNILEYISINEPAILSDISSCHQMSLPNTSRELKNLMEKNLINKFIDEKDRRKQYIVLSDEGKEVMKLVFHEVEQILKKRIDTLSGEQLQEIATAMELLQNKVFYK
ncbi:MarR family winged helix-turn-helix transcriptional regulator [Bacillus sp. MB2021]|uniref:MarR family winged helix-turn-helix transcriptional regulator n=1 Tax=Bacillus sp. MB2021 TaxID=1408303 RepID=UPI001E3AE99E|nr:MarR family transcriptional regulator [Bacillus sp. MB2021]